MSTDLGLINAQEYLDVASNPTEGFQNALNALPSSGGTVLLPSGYFALNDTLVIPRSKVVIKGKGDGVTVLAQTVLNKDVIAGSGLQRITIEDVWLEGTKTGTGSGLNLTKGPNPSVPYVTLRNFTANNMGKDGVSIENAIVSIFDRVQGVSCGRYGINLYGQSGGSSGTSCSLRSCYGNNCKVAGIRLFNMVYSELSACAADNDPVGYLIDSCQVVSLSACGAENPSISGLKITGGYGNIVNGFWVYNNKGVGIWITNISTKNTLTGVIENSPDSLNADYFLRVDSGCQVKVTNQKNVTSNLIAPGTTTIT